MATPCIDRGRVSRRGGFGVATRTAVDRGTHKGCGYTSERDTGTHKGAERSDRETGAHKGRGYTSDVVGSAASSAIRSSSWREMSCTYS